MLFEDLLLAEGCIGGSYGFPQTEEPVWLLGIKYCTLSQRQELEEDFRTRIWMTYRRGFPSIGGDDGPTSDRGWGCMLRCGQMVLAEALIRHTLGRRWRWSQQEREEAYLDILEQFADREHAPFSIHQIALTGERTARKPVGTWFGPNTVAQTLRHVTETLPSTPVLHVAMDSCVVRADVRAACGTWRRPLLLLVPLRLGLAEMNAVYCGGVRSCFTIPHTLGIIGGTPDHALYFVGCVGDRLVYLDPHTTQAAVSVGRKCTDADREADRSYHCDQPCFMPITAMDPSIAVAFFCQTEAEFDSLCEHVQRVLIDSEKHPMLELRDNHPEWHTAAGGASALGAEASSPLDFETPDSRAALGDGSDDEFVVL